MITTTPAGLDVILDGQRARDRRRRSRRRSRSAPHTIAVRQDGVELWHQTIEAEPSSDYEIAIARSRSTSSASARRRRHCRGSPRSRTRRIHPTSQTSKPRRRAPVRPLPGAVAAITPPSPTAPTTLARQRPIADVTVAKPSAPATTPPAPIPGSAKPAPTTPTTPNVAKPAAPVPAKMHRVARTVGDGCAERTTADRAAQRGPQDCRRPAERREVQERAAARVARGQGLPSTKPARSAASRWCPSSIVASPRICRTRSRAGATRRTRELRPQSARASS